MEVPLAEVGGAVVGAEVAGVDRVRPLLSDDGRHPRLRHLVMNLISHRLRELVSDRLRAHPLRLLDPLPELREV